MPRINISEDVLAAIRARCRDGKEPEDRILSRLLGLHGGAPVEDGPGNTGSNTGGFVDATYGIHFPEGFEISRTYKGRPYAARVTSGRWLLDADMNTGGRTYDSLNQLSQAVIDGNENAWMFWFFQDPDGTRRRISEFRDPALVQKRPRRHRQRGARHGVIPVAPGGVLPVAQGGVIPTPVAPPPAPVQPARAPKPVSAPPAPALPSPPKPAAGGMAWQPPAKSKQA